MLKLTMLLAGLFILAAAGASFAKTGSSFIQGASYKVADSRDVVHDNSTGSIARTSNGECVRTKWVDAEDPCATKVVTPPVAHDTVLYFSREQRTVYVGFNQTDITPPMKHRLDALADLLRGQPNIKGVRIVGYADRIGNPAYNEALSKRRAENVRQYLIARGITKAEVADTRWLGSDAPTTNCPNTLKRPELIDCLQQDRRVEVEIDYTPNAQASAQDVTQPPLQQ